MTRSETVLVGSDRYRDLVDSGLAIVGESWGARLRLGDHSWSVGLPEFIADVTNRGTKIVELGVARIHDIVELESRVAGDYPVTPATQHEAPTAADLRALFDGGARGFGALDASGRLVAVTVVRILGDRAETEFTSVDPDFRGAGLSKAVKAASILAFAADGVRVFGTGGAAVNEASLRMNAAVGYVVTERWASFDVSRETSA